MGLLSALMLTIVGSQLFLVHDSQKDWRDGVLGVLSFLSFSLMLMATVRRPGPKRACESGLDRLGMGAARSRQIEGGWSVAKLQTSRTKNSSID